MKHIVLLSCVKRKLEHRAQAQFLYTSPLFKLSLAYARHLEPDKIYILSAEHGLLPLDAEVEPYEKTIITMPRDERVAWAKRVLGPLSAVSDLQKDHFIILAGRDYYQPLLPALTHYQLPLGNLGLGKRIQFLKEQCSGL